MITTIHVTIGGAGLGGLTPRYLLRGPARGPLASGPGMTVAPCRTDDLGVVSPGPRGTVTDADQGSGHCPVRRNAGPTCGRQVCITWMRANGPNAEAGTASTHVGAR